jgi:hypothetical protein
VPQRMGRKVSEAAASAIGVAACVGLLQALLLSQSALLLPTWGVGPGDDAVVVVVVLLLLLLLLLLLMLLLLMMMDDAVFCWDASCARTKARHMRTLRR